MAGVVDGVDHRVEPAVEDFRGGLLVEKLAHDLEVAAGMDRQRALRHRVGFLASDLPVHRVELAVHVGDADFIQIDQREMADAGACQRFHRPRPHSTHADHGDTGC